MRRAHPVLDRARDTCVLVIDDDLGTRGLFVGILRPTGVRVEIAASGTEALAKARRGGVDLMVVDLRLPDISGLEVIRTLRDEQICIPFVVVSGFATVREAVEAMKLGALSVLEKPTCSEAVVSIVCAALADAAPACIGVGPESIQRAPSPAAADVPAFIGSRQGPGSAAERWALYVLKACEADRDPKTLDEWARSAGVSYRCLRESCYILGIRPHAARDFTRVLRALLNAPFEDDLVSQLDIADTRSLKNLLRRAGLEGVDARGRRRLEHYLHAQEFIPVDNAGLASLHAVLGKSVERR